MMGVKLVHWRLAVPVVVPLLLLPMLLVTGASSEARCGYGMIIVAVFWMTEAVPLPITSILPAVLFPLLGVLSSKETCQLYMNQSNMMFFAGIVLAIAVEYCKLHERIALTIILKVGQSPQRLLLSFMLTTMLLSMWLSNTASTAMMIPIVDAVMIELYKDSSRGTPSEEERTGLKDVERLHDGTLQKLVDEKTPDLSMNPGDSQTPTDQMSPVADNPHTMKYNKQRNITLLAVAYAANIGGTGTVTGTTPNILLVGLVSSTYGPNTGLNYATWMMFGVPTMVVATLSIAGALLLYTMEWKTICSRYFKCTEYDAKDSISDTTVLPDQEVAAREVILRRYRALGPMSFHEKTVLIIFISVVFLWFTRSPEFMPGWGNWFDVNDEVMVGGATPAVLALFLLFVVPADPSALTRPAPAGALLTWDVLRSRFPWDVLFIIGAGFVLARATAVSGLSIWITQQLAYLSGVPSGVAVFLICLLTASLTEVMSNTATTSILLPVLNDLATVLRVNPLYLLLPATISASFAFMLPVATAPNILVFSASKMRTTEMMRIGFFMNLICLFVLNLSINTLGVVLFDLNTLPQWANTTKIAGH